MPQISVIIPSYNHANYIGDAIQSVLDQTYQDFEIIITDDGSSDGTVEEIKKFHDDRIKLFCFDHNKGASVAVNNCLRESQGEFIAIMNSDDICVNNRLEKQVDFLKKNQHFGAVFSHLLPINENGEAITDTDFFTYKCLDSENKSRHQWLSFFFSGQNAIVSPSAMVRRECFDSIGYYDERLAQVPDWDIWIRLCMKYEIHIIQERLIKYRIRDNNQNVSADKPGVRVRVVWEGAQVLKKFLKIEDVEDFKKIFPDAIKSEIIDKELLPFYLAKIALTMTNSIKHQYFAVNLLYDILSDEKIAKKLIEENLFDYLDLIKLTGERDIFMKGKFRRKNTLKNKLISKLMEINNRYGKKHLKLAMKKIYNRLVEFKK